MEVRTQPLPDNICIFLRQYFCCRRKRQWNPINQRKPKVRRERSRVTFAAKVNKVEPLFVHQESLDETCSDDNSDHGITYDDRLKASEEKASEENSSTTALLDERFSDKSSSESEYEEGEVLTVEAFIEKYVQDTIHAALDQWRKDCGYDSQTQLQDIDEEDDPE
ncbi:uncharacterized protein LOC143056821 [Mytilus galloprovincialis]|uniref:uncharacterized protein LOC143056821 n=1 Tax=Mytilus galloprovincialis TaxID=29158 RepID=UPI003F7B6F2F